MYTDGGGTIATIDGYVILPKDIRGVSQMIILLASNMCSVRAVDYSI